MDGDAAIAATEVASLVLQLLAGKARDVNAADRAHHEKRARAVEALVKHALQQKVLHDDSPVANFVAWDAFTSRLDNLRAALNEPEFNHALAVKANPTRGLLREACRRGFGAECASFGEAKHALSLGFAPRKVVYDSPCKTYNELKEMLLAGVYINLDNEYEFTKLHEIFRELGPDHDMSLHQAQIGLRINPVVGGGSIASSSTATATSKFGLALTLATKDRLIAIFRDNAWLQGVHVHVGSQGCPLSLLVAGVKRSVDFAREINSILGKQQIQVIDIGGGVPTIYNGGTEEAYDFKAYADALHEGAPELFSSGFSSIITEFGRSIFVKPGVTVSKVEAVKDWADQHIAVIHVGADQFPRTAYLPEMWPHVVTVLSRDGSVKPATTPYLKQDVAGPLCFSGDFMAKKVWLPQIEVGDYIVIHDTGGYTLSMYSKFNSREAPSSYAYKTNASTHQTEFALLKQRETTEETLSFWGLDTEVTFGA